MEPIKTLIFISLIVLLIAFSFRRKIAEEIRLFRQAEASELLEDLTLGYFHPFSDHERIDTTRDYIEKMKGIQDRVLKSIFAKRFVDYREHILEKQKELLKRKNNNDLDKDLVTFSTVDLHFISASPNFSKKHLL